MEKYDLCSQSLISIRRCIPFMLLCFAKMMGNGVKLNHVYSNRSVFIKTQPLPPYVALFCSTSCV